MTSTGGPRVVRLSNVLGDAVSRAACAYAVAMLAQGAHPDAPTPSVIPFTPLPLGPLTFGERRDEGKPSGPRPAVYSRRAKWDGAAEVVVKVGGSLFDLPDLAARLQEYLAGLPPRTLLVSGGGRLADCVRQWDAVHALGEERAHWLAIRSMSLGSHFLAALLPTGHVVTSLDECPALWTTGQLPILDPRPLLQRASCGPNALPSSWKVTSDSIAAWVARQAAARQLVLLKSAELPKRLTIAEAVDRELVDPYFATACAGLEQIVCVNLRRQPIEITTLARSDAGIS